MNLLPGLRELRAPLVSGYLWLISAWLFLGRMEWLPTERPPGNGEVARLWDLGGTLGKTVVLAAVTFLAYLIGSFFEINPDGRIANSLTPLALADHRPFYLGARDKPTSWIAQRRANARILLDAKGIKLNDEDATTVHQSISEPARRDLIDLLDQRAMLPENPAPYEPLPDELDPSQIVRDEELQRYEIWSRDDDRRREQELANEMAADTIIIAIVREMQQLASRLLVKNQELYGKYDRQMAEASVRMNVSIPLTVLLLLATWLSHLAIGVRAVLSVAALAFGFMLLRQGLLRAMSARDVILQALVIGQVESRYLPSEASTKKPAEKTREELAEQAHQHLASSQSPSTADQT
jgi:hypothetical protein